MVIDAVEYKSADRVAHFTMVETQDVEHVKLVQHRDDTLSYLQRQCVVAVVEGVKDVQALDSFHHCLGSLA